jgi:hypothetical protein
MNDPKSISYVVDGGVAPWSEVGVRASAIVRMANLLIDDGDGGDYQECLPESGNVGLVTPPQPSKDGTCSSRSNGKYTCEGSSYGDCCSYLGFW